MCDRALQLVGFAGAFRRSEVVSLDVADVMFSSDGLVAKLRRSKTDQEGEGRKVGLPFGSNPLTCPVRGLRAWLDVAAIARGPIFRSVDRHSNVADSRLTDQSVALVVKRCAKAAGLDWEKYAGHSLRSGLATAAADGGRLRASDHGPDRAQVAAHGPPLHPGWFSIQGCVDKSRPAGLASNERMF